MVFYHGEHSSSPITHFSLLTSNWIIMSPTRIFFHFHEKVKYRKLYGPSSLHSYNETVLAVAISLILNAQVPVGWQCWELKSPGGNSRGILVFCTLLAALIA